MEQKEYAATLAALGTIGVAATGLALGTSEGVSYSIRPGKRKWPGSDITGSNNQPQTLVQNRRAVSQPISSTTPQDCTPTSSRASFFKRRFSRDLLDKVNLENEHHEQAQSRDSSRSRLSMLRPWTAETKSSTDRRNISTGSSWLKRMSSLSSTYGSSPAPSIHHEQKSANILSPWSTIMSSGNEPNLPNKLVKRTMSQRAASYDHSKGHTLRRPATSHQRVRTSSSVLLQSGLDHGGPMNETNMPEGQSNIAPANQIWRPFFDCGYARKRRQTQTFIDVQQIKTIAVPYLRCPTLVLGNAIERSNNLDDKYGRGGSPSPPPILQRSSPPERHKLRRSMNSIRRSARRRNFTDPTVQVTHADANGTISPMFHQSPLSPMSHVSTFDIELPHGTPIFSSSPPINSSDKVFASNNRNSIGPSDPITTSSDNDTRIFTDDDSLDFRSDTAYDSIATRATSGSQSGLRISKLETIFAGRTSDEVDRNGMTLESLMQNASLRDHEMSDVVEEKHDEDSFEPFNSRYGLENPNLPTGKVTPVDTALDNDDMIATPVPAKKVGKNELSSPLLPIRISNKDYEMVGDMIDDMDIDDKSEDLDWSPKVDVQLTSSPHMEMPLDVITESEVGNHYQDLGLPPLENKRISIFDWSEHPPSNSPRPKTVHGNQGKENRSRSSGRKEMHLRSQSVPVSREAPIEETPQSVSKYSTWGLGHKPVSEEWSDDFDFDDLEEPKNFVVPKTNDDLEPKGSIRSVKVPQAIIDRQASVHLQFGQVQEFMLLVEELKRLRVRGIALNLVESHSKQLWEDAESIINLATINEEENRFVVPASPTSSDIFGDDLPTISRNGKDTTPFSDTKRHSGSRRSVSSSATTPVANRPRGESLAQAKNFLQTIHQNRIGPDSSPAETDVQQQKKLPFDTQDLRDLVVRSGVITRALKEIVRRAEGVSISPQKTPPKPKDPPFSYIFNVPEDHDGSPCPPFRKPGLPKSRSANSYMESSTDGTQTDSFPARLTLAAMV